MGTPCWCFHTIGDIDNDVFTHRLKAEGARRVPGVDEQVITHLVDLVTTKEAVRFLGWLLLFLFLLNIILERLETDGALVVHFVLNGEIFLNGMNP
jgi:hypothetical protein